RGGSFQSLARPRGPLLSRRGRTLAPRPRPAVLPEPRLSRSFPRGDALLAGHAPLRRIPRHGRTLPAGDRGADAGAPGRVFAPGAPHPGPPTTPLAAPRERPGAGALSRAPGAWRHRRVGRRPPGPPGPRLPPVSRLHAG